MAKWVNRTLVQDPRNGTVNHTITFTPAVAGNLLVAVAQGSVTFTTPTGWTLPANGMALNNGGLYVWYKTATAGESSLTTTNNGPNYPVVITVYEFASGSAFLKAASSINQPPTSVGPTINGLTGTNLIVSALGFSNIQASGSLGTGWTTPTIEDVDVAIYFAVTDGCYLSIGYIEDSTATSIQLESDVNGIVSGNLEKLSFAVNVATVATGTAYTKAPADTGAGTDAPSSVLVPGGVTLTQSPADTGAGADTGQPQTLVDAESLTDTGLGADAVTATNAAALRVRGVITAPGVESSATLRGVITAPGVEALALVREVVGTTTPTGGLFPALFPATF